MIFQAVKLIANELKNDLEPHKIAPTDTVIIGNIAFHESEKYSPAVDGNTVISLFKVEEEKTLRNAPAYTKNPSTDSTIYHNPPVHVNLYILITFNQLNYENALEYQSRTMHFFQQKNVFTDQNSPTSLSNGAFKNFRLVLELCTLTFEQINHLWGVLGGKQLPFVMYKARMIEVLREQPQEERGVITEIDVKNVTD